MLPKGDGNKTKLVNVPPANTVGFITPTICFAQIPSKLLIPIILGVLLEPQLKSIYNFPKSGVLKKSEVKVKGLFWNILSIMYLIFIKGLNACCNDVNSGLPKVALLPVEPLAINQLLFQFTKGYFNVLKFVLKPDVFALAQVIGVVCPADTPSFQLYLISSLL